MASPTDFSLLFSLPPELRLTLYSHLTAFTLLQLSHTSRQFHTEINIHPVLIRSSLGYFDRTRDQYRYFLYIKCQIDAARRSHFDEDGKGFVTLNIGLIDRLGSLEEYCLFQEIYNKRTKSNWRCCEQCFKIDRALEGTKVKNLLKKESYRDQRDERLWKKMGEDGWVCSVCWAMFDQHMDRNTAEYVVMVNNERWQEYLYEIE